MIMAGTEGRSHLFGGGADVGSKVVVHANRVACDHEGCENSVAFQVLRPGATDSFSAERLPRHLARREGWRIGEDGDFWPRHCEVWEIREI